MQIAAESLPGVVVAVLENVVWPLIVTAIAALGGLVWRSWPTVRGWLKRHEIVARDPHRFNVLVARLNGDDGRNSNRRHIVRSLRKQPGIEVVTDIRSFAEVEAGSDTDRLAEVRDSVKRRLRHTGCDIAIFGDVVAANQALYLHVVPSSESSATADTYALESQKLELPQYFGPAFSEALLGTALAATAPAVDTESRASYLVETLRPARDKLQTLMRSPPDGMADTMQASLHEAYANTCLILGEQSGRLEDIEEAVQAYLAALEVHTCERLPLGWAATQNNLGNALRTLGQREEGTARLEEAVAAYRAALEVHTRERLPLGWAATQNNLGNALSTLGEREEGTARLEEAVAAYRAALEVHTRERLPLDWGMTQNNLGNALRVLGEREEGMARLEEAVAAFRAALELYARERLPLCWAMTQNNLGNALKTLGEREKGTARLEDAVAAYRAALEVRTRERLPLDWGMTQNNLGNALRALGEREEGMTRLEEALSAYDDALKVLRSDSAPAYHQVTTCNRQAVAELIQSRCGANVLGDSL
ncbi:tetratricopeptide repeat protein [Rhodovibrio salinarum]|uniref:tetratricopeptide repeat protein n=1 Tax=Rhodovibrio salinarum TaxID=1087 RepID=UPI0012DC26C1|nr:tetratricopeptide repeat protein [Rhodovibrio salinarum]